jgi:hypothetical protein
MTKPMKPGDMHSAAWCPIPFTAISLHPTGKLTRCMMSEEYMSNRTDYDWDNPDFQKLRTDMLNGEWDEEGCINCKMKEDTGVRSQRQNWLVGGQRKRFPEGAYDNPQITGNTVRHLFLNFGNVCNFKCRMCSPRYSNSLIPEHKYLVENVNKYHKYEPENSKNINNVENFLIANKDRLKDVVSIWVTGGEPFIGDAIWNALDILEKYADPSKIRISVTTNGSRVSIPEIERFKIFKQLHFDLSLDAIGPLFEYMRSDGVFTWEQMDSFINQLSEFKKHHSSWLNVSLNSSYQVYNAMDIENFFNYTHKHFGTGAVNMRVLVGPQQYQARQSPDNVKAEGNRQIQALLDRITDPEERRIIIDCQKMLNRDRDEDLSKRLGVYTHAKDKFRDKYVKDYLPTLSEGLVE